MSHSPRHPVRLAALCPAGSYCPAGSGSPVACPAGLYGNVQGLATSACVGALAWPGGGVDGAGGKWVQMLVRVKPPRPPFYPGPCTAGYYCTGGASSPTQYQVRGAGDRSPRLRPLPSRSVFYPSLSPCPVSTRILLRCRESAADCVPRGNFRVHRWSHYGHVQWPVFRRVLLLRGVHVADAGVAVPKPRPYHRVCSLSAAGTIGPPPCLHSTPAPPDRTASRASPRRRARASAPLGISARPPLRAVRTMGPALTRSSSACHPRDSSRPRSDPKRVPGGVVLPAGLDWPNVLSPWHVRLYRAPLDLELLGHVSDGRVLPSGCLQPVRVA